MKNQNLLQDALRLSADEEVKDLIRRFLLSNAPTPAGKKFDPYKVCTPKNYNREFTHGVMHRDGKISVTDSYSLYRFPADYPAEFEGKLIAPDRSEIEIQKYPEFDPVLPKGEPIARWTVNREAVADAVKQQRQAKKEGKLLYIRLNKDTVFEPARLLNLCEFAEEFMAESVELHGADRGAVVRSCEAVGLLLPTTASEFEDKFIFIDL